MNTCKCGREIPHRPNSTIKNKLCPKCTYEQALKRPRKSPEVKLATFGIKPRKASVKNIKVANASYYMSKADLWFSRYIRISKGIVCEGEVFCVDIITGGLYLAKNIDNGHYFSRIYNSTRYYPDNCWPQNRSSNRFRGEADKDTFRERIISKIGNDRFRYMVDIKASLWTGNFQEEAEKYERLVKELIVEKKVNKWW